MSETKSGTPKLNEALKKAQEEMVHPKRTTTNPHFGSKYADLDDCWEAWMKVGPKNGLTVSQGGGVGAPPNHLRLVTTLAHVSGEERASTLDIPRRAWPTGAGNAFTCHMVGGAIAWATELDKVNPTCPHCAVLCDMARGAE